MPEALQMSILMRTVDKEAELMEQEEAVTTMVDMPAALAMVTIIRITHIMAVEAVLV
jgi:hypothetical protein